MKKLFTLFAALSLAVGAYTDASAADYPTTYTANDRSTHESRFLKSLTVAADGTDVLTITAGDGVGSPLVYDKTGQTAVVKPGAMLSFAPQYLNHWAGGGEDQASWMHGYVYVDLGNDGQFSYDVDNGAHTALATSDLRSFSFYDFGGNENTGWDSEGKMYTGDERRYYNVPAFAAPQKPGTYRVRYKLDWDNIDPAGAVGMKKDGGAIVDFMLKVEGDEPAADGKEVPYTADFATTLEGWTTIDKSDVPGKTWAFSEKAFYSEGQYYPGVTMTPDYASAYNDYYVSPAIALKAGVTYTVSTLAFKSASGPEVSLLMGGDTTDLAQLKEVAQLTLPTDYDASAVETHQVTVEADGNYFFAFKGTTQQYNPAVAILMQFAVTAGDTPEPPTPEYMLPYTADFKAGADNWTAIDNNADGATWKQYSQTGAAVDSKRVDDTYASPLFSLEAGKSYTVTVTTSGAQVDPTATLSLLAGTDVESMGVVKEQLRIASMGDATDEVTFSPRVSGKYLLALKETIEQADETTMPLYLTSFAIKETEDKPQPADAVFTADFDKADPAEGWIVIDENEDGNTWQGDATAKGITYDGQTAAPAGDMLVTPAFKVKKNQDYTIEFTFNQSGAFDPDKVQVDWGNEATLTALSNLIAEDEVYAEGGSGTVTKTYRFTPGIDGDAYLALTVRTQQANGKLSLTGLVVKPAEKAIPNAVTDFKATVNSGSKQIELQWTNPTTDTGGLPISSPLRIEIDIDGYPMMFIDDAQAGEAMTYSFALDPFEGTHTVGVRALLNEEKSDAVTATIDLGDVQGAPELVKAFDVNSTTAADWKTENLAGTSVWKYDYSNIFRFDYQLGQKEDNDWLISPAVELEQGKRYIARYELSTAMTYGANVDVTIGTEQQSDAQTTVIASHPNLMQNGFAQFETKQFAVDATGSYFVGFHVFNASYSVNMCNLAIYWINPDGSGVEKVEADDALAYNAATCQLVLPVKGAQVSVFDLQGRRVLSTHAAASTLSLSALPKGMYVVKADGAQWKGTLKIVK